VVARERERGAVGAEVRVVARVAWEVVVVDDREDATARRRPGPDARVVPVEELVAEPADLGQRRLEDRDVDTSARDVELPRSQVGEVLAGTRPLGPSAFTKLARRAAVDVEHAEMDLFVVSGDRRRGRDREDAAEGEPRPVGRPFRDRDVLDRGDRRALGAAEWIS